MTNPSARSFSNDNPENIALKQYHNWTLQVSRRSQKVAHGFWEVSKVYQYSLPFYTRMQNI